MSVAAPVIQPSLAVSQQSSSAGAHAQPPLAPLAPLAPTAFEPVRVINLADLPKHVAPDGFRTSSEGKCIPENCDTDSNYARRLRFVDRRTGEVLSQAVTDSEYALRCAERFDSARKAIEDATTDGSDRSSAASDYCHRCEGRHDGGSAAIMSTDPKFRVCVDCATDEELLAWGHEEELKERIETEAWHKDNVSAEEAESRDGVVPMGDVVTDPRAVQVFLAGVRSNKKRASGDEDAVAKATNDNKRARADEDSASEDGVPGTPPGAAPYAAPGSSIVPHRQSASRTYRRRD